MKRWGLKLTAICLAVLLIGCNTLTIEIKALEESVLQKNVGASFETVTDSLNLPCKSAVLMEATTGTVLYTQNPDEALPPASVTKIMTLLLLMEAIDAGNVRLDSTVTVSENAASMGGSQVYLKEGEQMSVEDLLKSVVISSANDAAVALAEYLCGSVSAFVERMNERAKSLKMNSTVFENVTGLDDTALNHLTSARDIALMSCELISHKTILNYSSIWMDSIRNGQFGLTNTNRLVRFYSGCTGLKTGSTAKAGFCVSATAEREGMSLICVIMGAESRDIRNAAATQLLDWGFANYGVFTSDKEAIPPIKLVGGEREECALEAMPSSLVVKKEQLSSIKKEIVLPEQLVSPIRAGDQIGRIDFYAKEELIGSTPIVAAESVNKISFFGILYRMTAKFLLI